MKLIKLFTSFDGRTSRLGFWFGIATLAIAGASLAIPAYPNILSDNPFRGLIKNFHLLGFYGLAISLLLLYPAMAIVIKRLHDRNKGGWRAALFWAPALMQTAAIFTGWTPELQKLYNITTWVSGYLIAVGIWFVFELGFLDGTDGPNDYGPES